MSGVGCLKFLTVLIHWRSGNTVLLVVTYAQILAQERHRIDVDCRRTDRTHPLFVTPLPSDSATVDDEKEANKRYSSISPNMSDVGAQAPSNEHIERLAGILLTYNFYEKELGSCLTHYMRSITTVVFLVC